MTHSLLHATASLTQLLDDEAGAPLGALDLLRADRTEVLRLKHRLQVSRVTGEGRILCAICGVPVYMSAMPDAQTFVFKHFHEDGNCPHITRDGMTAAQINAYTYNAQRESARHIRIKQLVAESIQCDPSFSTPVIEGTWRGREGDLRRPDVRSRFKDEADVAFEVQLSTTFGSVMAEREVFYRKEGGLLLWVFGEFDPERARLMMQVVFAINNRNAFVVNEQTLAASREAGALWLECHWDHPSMGEQNIIWTPRRKLVRFDELTLDRVGQRAFYVDTDRIEAELKRQLAGPPLSEQLEALWLDYEAFQGRERPSLIEIDTRWRALQDAFARCRVNLPSRHHDPLVGLLRALYSAKHGASVGWRYERFWDAAHHVFDAEQAFGWIFYPALQVYGRLATLEAQDKSGKWRRKVETWQGSNISEDHTFDPLIQEAFPELAAHLTAERGSIEEWEEAPF